MGPAARAWLALCLLVALPSALSKIEKVQIHGDDRTLIPLSEAFGFVEGGTLNVTIWDIGVFSKHGNWSYSQFGLFLSTPESEPLLEEDATLQQCPLVEKESVLFTFDDDLLKALVDGTAAKHTNFTFHFTLQDAGQFYLFFANCEPGTFVSFNARITLYNTDDDGARHYLSVGETELSTVCWIMFALFAAGTAAWCAIVWLNRSAAHKLHLLMAVLGGFKCLTLLSQALMYHYVDLTGEPDGWNIAYYFFTLCRGVLFFTVVVLVGTGWSYMKPFLGDREKRILLVVIPLQVFANIAIVVTDEENPSVRDWFTWRDVFHLVDIICCCAILFPIVWSIKHLREASQTDGKAARVLQKLTLFRQYYVVLVIYIYFTRIVVYLLRATMQFEFEYIADVADQLATLAFYAWTAYAFRPHTENPYLKVDSDDEEDDDRGQPGRRRGDEEVEMAESRKLLGSNR